MNIPILPIILTLPSLIFLAMHRRKGGAWREGLRHVGWQWPKPVDWLWGGGVLALMSLLGWLALHFVPANILQDPNLNVSGYVGLTPGFAAFLIILVREAFVVALGEEIFFRGWLGGWLVRRFGFAVGNLAQAVCFLLPHLFLLLISVQLWPILLVQFAAGWLLGWLRHRSSSILPGWVAHSLVNALSAFSMLA